MKTISRILCSLALLSVACDDGNGSVDRTATLPESLLEQGWYIDDDGELVRELEDGTIEHALPEEGLVSEEPATQPEDASISPHALDDLTAPADPAAVTGVWTALPGLESCIDLFTAQCSLTVPSSQCYAGATCEWYPGASCYQVMSAWSVKSLYCKK